MIDENSVELPDRRGEVRVRSPVLDGRQLPSHADLKIDTQVSKYKTVFGAATHPKLSQQGMVALNSGAVDIHSRILVPNIEEPDEITDLEVASLLVGIGQVGKRARGHKRLQGNIEAYLDPGMGPICRLRHSGVACPMT